MPSKSEISHIRQAAAAARLRLKAAHCDAIKAQPIAKQPEQERSASKSPHVTQSDAARGTQPTAEIDMISGALAAANVDPVSVTQTDDRMDIFPKTPPSVRRLFSESPISNGNKFLVLSSLAQNSLQDDSEEY